MKKFLVFLVVMVVVVGAGFWYRSRSVSQPAEKIYVAVEGDGAVAVINPSVNKVISRINLSVEHDGGILPFAPHNIQVAPDAKSVWVTANAKTHADKGHGAFLPMARAHGDEEKAGEPDEVIIIDPLTDRIIKRIPVKAGIHLAHVALTPDSNYAYATAQEESAIYKINAKTYEVEKRIAAPVQSEPHGIRIAPDNSAAYIALLEGKGIGVLNLESDALKIIPLGGKAVQTGVTPDGKKAFASLYDTKQIAVYDTETGLISYIGLLENSKGPVQLYPTPDSRYIYVADQGYYFNEPSNDKVYKIELATEAVTAEIKAGQAPHGVVVSADGRNVYVTNLLSGDVSVIDAATNIEVARIPVGREPNGVSEWKKPRRPEF